MDNHQIIKMKTHFDGLSHTIPDENVEFWFARELQEALGYVKWERFNDAIQRAIRAGFGRLCVILHDRTS